MIITKLITANVIYEWLDLIDADNKCLHSIMAIISDELHYVCNFHFFFLLTWFYIVTGFAFAAIYYTCAVQYTIHGIYCCWRQSVSHCVMAPDWTLKMWCVFLSLQRQLRGQVIGFCVDVVADTCCKLSSSLPDMYNAIVVWKRIRESYVALIALD